MVWWKFLCQKVDVFDGGHGVFHGSYASIRMYSCALLRRNSKVSESAYVGICVFLLSWTHGVPAC